MASFEVTSRLHLHVRLRYVCKCYVWVYFESRVHRVCVDMMCRDVRARASFSAAVKCHLHAVSVPARAIKGCDNGKCGGMQPHWR